MRRGPTSHATEAGFTLLEAMVALLILAMALVSIVEIQGLSAKAVTKARDLTLVTQLARGKMFDLIQEIRQDGFGEFEEELECDFEEEEHDEIGCSATLAKVEIPLPGQGGLGAGEAGDAAAGAAEAAGIGSPEATGMVQEAAEGVVSMYASMIKETVEEAIRELTLTVTWKDGGRERSFTVSTHLIDVVRAGGQAIPGGGAIPGVSGGAFPGGSTGMPKIRQLGPGARGTHGSKNPVSWPR